MRSMEIIRVTKGTAPQFVRIITLLRKKGTKSRKFAGYDK